ncbi:hypothetical protein CLG85_014760 [Yangia mangrovi]|uniref:Uncharacterized protein n=1 Tax=Alloyangia mangrovi TaxID=1779329 RepID=A0A2A3JQ03_9RHOB|nr:hypothetical protein [Alloyangia mangrovi]MCA0939363.1 hypothetical protein [Alloyangia pacifica]MCA0943616.1 hypothetical protein [Alloyangia pacifica]MCT4371511.1 hypothetical protein [Alloyangia mangrovi]
MDDRLKRRIDTVERALAEAQGAEHAALLAELERLAVEARVRGVALPSHVRDRLRCEVDAELEARFDNMPI